jgi:hypothetical protein
VVSLCDAIQEDGWLEDGSVYQSTVRRSYTKFRILTVYSPSVERTAVTCQSKLAYASCGTAGQLHYRTAAEHTPRLTVTLSTMQYWQEQMRMDGTQIIFEQTAQCL